MYCGCKPQSCRKSVRNAEIRPMQQKCAGGKSEMKRLNEQTAKVKDVILFYPAEISGDEENVVRRFAPEMRNVFRIFVGKVPGPLCVFSCACQRGGSLGAEDCIHQSGGSGFVRDFPCGAVVVVRSECMFFS